MAKERLLKGPYIGDVTALCVAQCPVLEPSAPHSGLGPGDRPFTPVLLAGERIPQAACFLGLLLPLSSLGQPGHC